MPLTDLCGRTGLSWFLWLAPKLGPVAVQAWPGGHHGHEEDRKPGGGEIVVGVLAGQAPNFLSLSANVGLWGALVDPGQGPLDLEVGRQASPPKVLQDQHPLYHKGSSLA